MIMSHVLHMQYGWSSLQGACDRGNLDIVKVLMEYHADIELKNKVSTYNAPLIVL